MLLVDDHEPEAGERREHGGARADDDVDVAAADALPLIVALAVREPLCWIATRSPKVARNMAATAGVSAISGTSSSTPRPLFAHVLGEAQVDLGLAAAGHAVQQDCLKGLPLRKRAQRGVGSGLFGRERVPPPQFRSSATACSNGSRSTRRR